MAFSDGSAPPPEWAVGPTPSLDDLRAVLAGETPGGTSWSGSETEPGPADDGSAGGDGAGGATRRRPGGRSRAGRGEGRGGRSARGAASRGRPADPEADPRTRGSEPDPHEWARQIVLRQLTAAPRSRRHLEDVLRRKECPDEVAAAVLDRMEEVGLVDDGVYAGMLVRSQQVGRGLARRALRQELRRKGVDDDTAAEALAEVDPHDEEERARALVAKKMRTMHGLEPHVQTRRLAGMLARKGYDAEVTMRLVREAVREAPEHRRD
ncbi:regulatory protein RecX [Arthrobacter sp. NEB 688]|uniref:regulatory protein RecX n=1 Tax=Arthrobacter sp. NEB 688 TaxID=904039 RepID=UPI0015673DA1|nr:regulatory protein RecX [Arthrobacter sp. NEB 688]QKE85252.1 regulatory protein RecX [Arthrobacter sp. NEB 688]